MARLRDLSVKDYFRLVGWFLLAVLIGLAFRSWYPHNWRGCETLYALGDGLIVAGVLGILLELFAAKFLIERVAEDLSQKLVGRGLPKELQEHIGKIVKTDIARDHYIKSYYFHDPIDGKVKIDITITFRVRNYSDSAKPYVPDADEEVFFDPQFSYLEYGIEGEVPISLNAQQLAQSTKVIPDTNVRTVKGAKPIKLKSIHSDPKAVCAVMWKYTITMPEEFSDVTAFRAATMGVKLHVDNIPPVLTFISAGDGMLPHVEGSSSWEYTGTYIGGQHVRSWWFHKGK
ncbi:MAG TPA: hypothetical protein VG204_10670 [Terriglobia bacterium]|nr:hypothetical protein [Terriglobia bacterium]